MSKKFLFGILIVAMLFMLAVPVMAASCPGWFNPSVHLAIWGAEGASGDGTQASPTSIANARAYADACASEHNITVIAFWTTANGKEDFQRYSPPTGDLIATEALYGIAVVAALGLIAGGFWLRRRANASPV